MRILLVVAYDGTAYHGWQVQNNEPMTIEGELNRVLSELTNENIRVIGASRTDAGVHAKGNIAVFDTTSTIPPESYVKAMNGKLPADIRIFKSYKVDDDFHPRHMDTRKTYCYRIYHSDICPPEKRLYYHHVYGPVNIDGMKKATTAFIGEHDFAAFCAANAQVETTVRTIYNLDVLTRQEADGEIIEIYVTGSGFLYNMVRIIAGTLLEVGRGRIKESDISAIIASCDRACSGPTLPPNGLFLEKYEFNC